MAVPHFCERGFMTLKKNRKFKVFPQKIPASKITLP